jgi:hypothetical protein
MLDPLGQVSKFLSAVAIGAGLLLPSLLSSGRTPQTPSPFLSVRYSVWKSQTTGNEYRVRIRGDTFSAEWTNIPAELAGHGAYVRTECRRVGTKWIGTTRSRLPCGSASKAQVLNWCPLVTQIEIDSIEPNRIAGRGQAIRRSDCQSCKLLEVVWKDFVWVPKREVGRPEE